LKIPTQELLTLSPSTRGVGFHFKFKSESNGRILKNKLKLNLSVQKSFRLCFYLSFLHLQPNLRYTVYLKFEFCHKIDVESRINCN